MPPRTAQQRTVRLSRHEKRTNQRVGPVQFLLPDPDVATESEVVNWLVPPPAAGTVSGADPAAEVAAVWVGGRRAV